MPHVTVPALNHFTGFQDIMHGENLSQVKCLLIATVTQMNARRRNWCSCFSSACTIAKNDAESNLLKALHASNHMDDVKKALRNYKQQLSGVQHSINMRGNTGAFMRGIGPLVDQLSPEIIRTDMKSAMEKAGYRSDEKKCLCKACLCYGIARTVLLTCVRQDGQAYMERMQYLEKMDEPPLPGRDTRQVYPFFDTVTIGMFHYLNIRCYEEYPVDPYFQVPIVKDAFIAECSPEAFIQFLQKTRDNNKGVPFGVIIHYPGYVAGIGFDGKKWLAAYHNSHYYTEHPEKLHAFLDEQSDFYTHGKIIAMMEVVTGKGYALNISKDTLAFNTEKSVYVLLAIHLALRYGDADIITDYMTTIGRQAETPQALFARLNCKDSMGSPGFFVTLQRGHTEAITAFIQKSAELVIRLSLPKEKKVELLCALLACETADGKMGFHMALQVGHTEAITAFIQESAAAIFLLDQPKEEKTKLLFEFFNRIKNNRKSVFLLAMKQGGPAVSKAFNEAIDQLPLSPLQKEALKYPTPGSVENAAVNQ